jgi:hypothetical protein
MAIQHDLHSPNGKDSVLNFNWFHYASFAGHFNNFQLEVVANCDRFILSTLEIWNGKLGEKIKRFQIKLMMGYSMARSGAADVPHCQAQNGHSPSHSVSPLRDDICFFCLKCYQPYAPMGHK